MYLVNLKKEWSTSKGIYKISFLNNDKNKCYVGSTSNKNGFKYRWGQHLSLLRRNKHVSPKLQNAYNKYGEDSLCFEILEHVFDFNILWDKEQHYIDLLKSFNCGYNILPKAGNLTGYKHRSKSISKMMETKSKKFDNIKNDVILSYKNGKTIRELCFDFNCCKETIRKILRNNNINRRNKASYFKIKIYQYDLEGNFIKSWNSAYEASSGLNIAESNIRRTLTGETLYAKKIHFSKILYKNPDEFINYKLNRKEKIYPGYLKRRQITTTPHGRITNIDQYDLNGNFIKNWKDTKEIVEFYGLKNATPVLRVLKGERKKFKESLWKTTNYKKRNCKSVRAQTQII